MMRDAGRGEQPTVDVSEATRLRLELPPLGVLLERIGTSA